MARRTTRRSKATAGAGRATSPATSPIDRAIDAAMQLAATQGWRDTTLADIAAAADMTLGELRRQVGGKTEILLALTRRADAAMLDRAADGASVRERLFDLLMRRLDALGPHKAGLKAVARDLPRDAAALLRLGCAAAQGMAWALDAAGANPRGALGRLRVKGLVAIYLGTLRTWADEDSADHGKTMAFLDKALRRAESLASPFSRRHKTDTKTET